MKITKSELRQRCIDNETAIATLETLLKEHGITRKQEPKPKQLDQSVFDGLDEKWRFAAVVADDRAFYFDKRPYDSDDTTGHFVFTGDYEASFCGTGYDTTNWQNSLIERDKVELTGSDLCRAMLARGDVCVPCFTSWDGDTEAIADKSIWLVHDFLPGEPNFHAGLEDFYFAVPINTRTGEPLTQSDVGL